MPPQDPKLSEIVDRLVGAFDPLRIFLFGSTERGEAGTDSDYDLMVIVPNDTGPDRRRSRRAYEALRSTGVAADVLVWTEEAFDSRLHLRASLPSRIVAERRVVYACGRSAP